MMNIKFKRLPNGKGLPLPSYATPGAAGIDLCAAEIEVKDGWLIISTGFAVEIPEGFEGQLRGRSGLAFKNGVLAHFGTIDSDYRGEVKVALFPRQWDDDDFPGIGDRIAQLVIAPVVRATIEESDGLSTTERGDGGFGSTGA